MQDIAKRYISESSAKTLNWPVVAAKWLEQISPIRWRSYDITKDTFTEWVIVPDDDPRVDTVDVDGRAR